MDVQEESSAIYKTVKSSEVQCDAMLNKRRRNRPVSGQTAPFFLLFSHFWIARKIDEGTVPWAQNA